MTWGLPSARVTVIWADSFYTMERNVSFPMA